MLEIPKAPTENVPLPIASKKPTDKSAAKMAFMGMPASKIPPPIEVDVAEHTTTGACLC